VATPADGRTFRDNRAMAAWTCRLAWLQAALAALTLATILLGITTPLPLIWFLAFVTGGIFGFRWLYIANGNARAMGATDLMGGPVMAIVWYFIPIANLGMPYVVMRDLWRASAKPRDWQGQSTPPLLILWWTCWLIFYLGLSAAGNFAAEESMDLAPVVGIALIVACAGFIPAALLFAKVVDSIQRLQDENGPAQLFR
jgi:hypothetical protein